MYFLRILFYFVRFKSAPITGVKLDNSRDSLGIYVTGNFDGESLESNFLTLVMPSVSIETSIRCVITYLGSKGRSDTVIRYANVSKSGICHFSWYFIYNINMIWCMHTFQLPLSITYYLLNDIQIYHPSDIAMPDLLL